MRPYNASITVQSIGNKRASTDAHSNGSSNGSHPAIVKVRSRLKTSNSSRPAAIQIVIVLSSVKPYCFVVCGLEGQKARMDPPLMATEVKFHKLSKSPSRTPPNQSFRAPEPQKILSQLLLNAESD